MQEPKENGEKVRRHRWRSSRTLSEMRRLAVFLWPHARAHKPLLLSGWGLSAILIALRLTQPWPLKMVIDLISHSPSSVPWVNLEPTDAIVLLSLLYILVSFSASLAEYWQGILLAGLGNRVLYSFRNQLFRHLLTQSLSFYERRDIGELVMRIVSDTSRLRRGINSILLKVFPVVVTFLSSIAVILWVDWRLAGIIGVCGGLVPLAMGKTGDKIFSAARRNRRKEGYLAAIVAEDVQGISDLQAFRPANLTDERFEGKNVKSLKTEQKVRRLGAGLLFRTEFILTLSACLVLWLGATAVHRGDLSLGSLILVLHYTVGLIGPFKQFAQRTGQIGTTMACAERLIKIMMTEPAVRNIPDARSVSAAQGDIALEQVSFKSPKRCRTGRKWLLENISISIKPGARVAVVGDNGAGKSSLLRLMLRLADPHQGCIRLDNHDIKEYTLESFRKQFSVVFQHSVFFGLTVRENIAFGSPESSLDQIKEAARRCGIHQWVKKLKQGYDTPVRRQGGLFSGGERQKLALARALLRDGRIWLLDEPVNGLDAEAKDGVIKLLLEATQGRTTFWVTHDFGIIRYCDRVLLLHEGRRRFFGTPEEFQAWSEHTGSAGRRSNGEDYIQTVKEIG